MPPEGMGAARGNCGFLDVSTILSKDRSSTEGVDCVRGDSHEASCEQSVRSRLRRFNKFADGALRASRRIHDVGLVLRNLYVVGARTGKHQITLSMRMAVVFP